MSTSPISCVKMKSTTYKPTLHQHKWPIDWKFPNRQSIVKIHRQILRRQMSSFFNSTYRSQTQGRVRDKEGYDRREKLWRGSSSCHESCSCYHEEEHESGWETYFLWQKLASDLLHTCNIIWNTVIIGNHIQCRDESRSKISSNKLSYAQVKCQMDI